MFEVLHLDPSDTQEGHEFHMKSVTKCINDCLTLIRVAGVGGSSIIRRE